MITKPDISFKDIAGNDYAKEVITQTFIMPTTHPRLYKDRLRPW
jgi:SpoVK/Ycf46/Vps4 family AAA+-type ATPase